MITMLLSVLVYLVLGIYAIHWSILTIEQKDEVTIKGGELCSFCFAVVIWPLFFLVSVIVGLDRKWRVSDYHWFTIRRKKK